jgi:hypothetical protein
VNEAAAATTAGRFDFPEYLSEGLLDHLIAKEHP